MNKKRGRPPVKDPARGNIRINNEAKKLLFMTAMKESQERGKKVTYSMLIIERFKP